ncbi:hypothetical protein GIB67_010438 [Kingdonia uniflora]|uniref:Uncharacterized protein n=1 Tax=Kingdonia uniflora TaxID=39325 RepID=A0A7J7MAQ0_9MAGN|nr:hypothetical protein GIB67_010438 [Kingdonia uniflora]
MAHIVRFRCFAEWAQIYGPIILVWFGSTLNVVVSNSELAKEVLKEKDQQLADRHRSRSAAKFSREGKDLIWADYGPHYIKVRKVCTLEHFSPKRLEALRPIREDEVTAMVESIFCGCTKPENYGKSLVVKNYLSTVAFNNITRLAFSKRFVNSEGVMGKQGVEFKEIVANGLKLGASLAMTERIAWLRWMFPFEEEAFAKHGARRDRLTKAIMNEHTVARDKSGGAKQHFVDALLTLQEKYEILARIPLSDFSGYDMITAGMDTTAISVEWGMAELIRNPRVQEKALEELDRVIGFDRVLTEPDFINLPYLQFIAKEVLRLHPPTPLMLPHKANANIKIGGYDVPKGSSIHVNVWAVARDPKVWKDPLGFRPERFMEEDVDMKGRDYRLLPFGAGRRVCPGAQLGINLVTSMLGHLFHHFSWAPPEGVNPEEVDMAENPGLVTYMRTPLQAVPTPRHRSWRKKLVKEEGSTIADRHRSRSAAKFSRERKDLIWADYGPHYVKVRKVSTLELLLEALRPIREDEVTAMVESIFYGCAKTGYFGVTEEKRSENYGKSLVVKNYLSTVAFNNITRLAYFVNSEGMFPLEEETSAKHGDRKDRLTRAIMDEHTVTREKSGGAKQHFVNALLHLKITVWDHASRRRGLEFDSPPTGGQPARIYPDLPGIWAPPEGVKPEEIDMVENPGLATYMGTPLQAVNDPIS